MKKREYQVNLKEQFGLVCTLIVFVLFKFRLHILHFYLTFFGVWSEIVSSIKLNLIS
jgi:hypothetical protein